MLRQIVVVSEAVTVNTCWIQQAPRAQIYYGEIKLRGAIIVQTLRPHEQRMRDAGQTTMVVALKRSQTGGLENSSAPSDHSLRPKRLFVLRPWAHRFWTWVGLTREARRRFEDDDVDVCDIRSASHSRVSPSVRHRSNRSLDSRQRRRQGFIRFEGRWYELMR